MTSRRNPAITIGLNVLSIAIFWVIAFILIRLIKTERVPSTVWPLVAAAIAVVIALKLHARYAAYLLGAIIAVMAAETGVALYYGHSALQGAATHFAVLAAGVIGVALGGWLVARYPISRPAQT